MDSAYWPDFKTQVTVPTSSVDTTITVPLNNNLDAINNPNNVGSRWFIMVDAVPVAVNVGAAAVYTNNAKIGVGSYLTTPLALPPGLVLHLITSSAAGSFSLVRARRAS